MTDKIGAGRGISADELTFSGELLDDRISSGNGCDWWNPPPFYQDKQRSLGQSASCPSLSSLSRIPSNESVYHQRDSNNLVSVEEEVPYQEPLWNNCESTKKRCRTNLRNDTWDHHRTASSVYAKSAPTSTELLNSFFPESPDDNTAFFNDDYHPKQGGLSTGLSRSVSTPGFSVLLNDAENPTTSAFEEPLEEPAREESRDKILAALNQKPPRKSATNGQTRIPDSLDLFSPSKAPETAGSLWLLLHAWKCKLNDFCTVPNCKVMQKVVRHCTECSLTTCVSSCDDAKAILCHYADCGMKGGLKSQLCLVCGQLGDFEKKTKKTKRHNVPIRPQPVMDAATLATLSSVDLEFQSRFKSRTDMLIRKEVMEHVKHHKELRSIDVINKEAEAMVRQEMGLQGYYMFSPPIMYTPTPLSQSLPRSFHSKRPRSKKK